MSSDIPVPHPPDWPVVRLGSITKKIGSGATPTGGEAAYQAARTNFALVRSQNVFDRRFETSGLAFITDEQAERLRGAALQRGDLLLNITGDGVTFGRCCAVPSEILPACVNQHVSIVRVDESIAHPGYVLSFLTHPAVKPYIESFNAGGSRRAITKANIESFELALPPLAEQKAIARILDSLDKKIEQNRRINDTLEAVARAIFKSWFIDFDPVRAKASREPAESICRRLNLTPDLLDKFPDRFVNSELGEIPEGWRVKPLPAAIQLNPTRALRNGSVAPYLDMANMPTAGARALAVVNREFGSGTKFKNGDTLVARITPCLENGKTCFVDFLEDGQVGWGSTEYLVFRPMPPLPLEFAYFFARTDVFRSHAIANMTGTSGRQRVPASAFDDFRIVVPGDAISEEFGRLAHASLEKMRASDVESQTLGQIRDALLPKLISGELRVPLQGAA